MRNDKFFGSVGLRGYRDVVFRFYNLILSYHLCGKI